MINIENVRRYCSNYEQIENYQEAVSSSKTYHCHHRNEITMGLSKQELIDNELYYNRPPEELIFLTSLDHNQLHRKGMKFPDETRKKMSDAQKGKTVSDETKKKISTNIKGNKNPAYKFICPIKLTYMYCKQEMSAYAIAKELEVDIKTIKRHLRELNISIRKR